MTKYNAIEKAVEQADKWFKESSWAEAVKNHKPSKKVNKGIKRALKQAQREFDSSFWKKALEIRKKEK